MSDDINEILTELEQELGIITLVTGQVEDREYWVYLSVPPEKFEAFETAQEEGAYDITEYGEILMWGEGERPTEEDIQQMIDEYGIDPDFEEKVKALAADLAKAMPEA